MDHVWLPDSGASPRGLRASGAPCVEAGGTSPRLGRRHPPPYRVHAGNRPRRVTDRAQQVSRYPVRRVHTECSRALAAHCLAGWGITPNTLCQYPTRCPGGFRIVTHKSSLCGLVCVHRDRSGQTSLHINRVIPMVWRGSGWFLPDPGGRRSGRRASAARQTSIKPLTTTPTPPALHTPIHKQGQHF